jgi:hypothetical protein
MLGRLDEEWCRLVLSRFGMVRELECKGVGGFCRIGCRRRVRKQRKILVIAVQVCRVGGGRCFRGLEDQLPCDICADLFRDRQQRSVSVTCQTQAERQSQYL